MDEQSEYRPGAVWTQVYATDLTTDSLGEMFKKSLGLWKRNWLRFTGFTLFPYIALFAFGMILSVVVDGPAFLSIIIIVALGLPLYVVTLLSYAATTVCAGLDSAEAEISIARCYGIAWSHILPLIVGAVLFALIFIVPALLSYVLIGIPLLVYLFVRLSFVNQIIVVEHMGAVDAISENWRLSKGSEWRILGYFAAVFGIIYAAMIPLSLIFVIGIVASAASDSSTLIVGIFIVAAIGWLVITVIMVPFMNIFTTLLYFDLRSKKEKYNKARLGHDLGVPPTAQRLAAEDVA